MRSSKSNPAKYARNYRAISQRRMTAHDDVDEEKEMKRLRNILKHSQDHLRKAGEGNDDVGGDDDNNNRKHKNKSTTSDLSYEEPSTMQQQQQPEDDEESAIARARALLQKSDHIQSSVAADDTMEERDMLKPLKANSGKKRKRKNNKAAEQAELPPSSEARSKEDESKKTTIIDSDILPGDICAPGETKNALILPGKKKKTKHAKKQIELTPQEIKQAKQLQKKTERKLKQLTIRAEQKKKRAQIYDQLQQHAISEQEMQLLSSSKTLGKRVSKKEQLKALVQKERAGISLSKEEQDLLYRDRGNGEDEEERSNDDPMDVQEATVNGKAAAAATASSTNQSTGDMGVGPAKQRKLGKDEQPQQSEPKKDSDAVFDASSFAAQMMSSLTTLKDKSEKQKEEIERKKQEEDERRQKEEEARQKANAKSRYVPSDPIVIQTAATKHNMPVHQLPASSRRILTIARPETVKASRYDLPVAQMEFEVMDAIRNNDVTIICSETGSGKSTQVPQMLYESGFSLEPSSSSKKHQQRQHKFQIGITQPRRVAAVSTAKRVCYEMGQGNGQSIKSNGRFDGNMVAYQTRYEKAGLGAKTCIKFMTDGILLQELQSDLLLRKYSVIVLDEFHERNLNSDCIAGLISAALPLRKKAAEEPDSGLVPLKLVIMSATLRVEDFVNNKKLFGASTPAVVRVPGRTHPVTIHHNKVTEFDNYEDVAFRKVCKIHRQLPRGGILVFLTGKQEIIRMVNRLRKALSPKNKHGGRLLESTTQSIHGRGDVKVLQTDIRYASHSSYAARGLDDEEVDGDLLGEEDDLIDDLDDGDELGADVSPLVVDEAGEGIPQDVLVLPLYSMLSTEEQAKVFQDVPEGTRLICVATNIAETSITIPNVSYVVDSGRHKCRNYDAKTGVSSFDVSWISKAASQQRAGRAGRTGPGHCYRLYSSSLFSRHMSEYELPEVLSRPLEDVVLAMKAMKISNIANFPFPTPPDQSQIDAAVKLLANLGCLELEDDNEDGDGKITPLGAAVATLPLGVRCGKMLLVGAHAGVLDYTIVIVAAMSEKSPFVGTAVQEVDDATNLEDTDNTLNDASDASVACVGNEQEQEQMKKKPKPRRWVHRGGDVLATMLAVGAYTYAGRGAGGAAEKAACRKFCAENSLIPATMERIQKIRIHLARLANTRMTGADGVAATTGRVPASLAPPQQTSRKPANAGSIPGSHPYSLRSAFLSCSSSVKEPLFMDKNSVLYSRDSRQLPQWVCYDTIVRKTLKDGTPIATMKNITPVDTSWLGTVSKGSRLLSLGAPVATPRPFFDKYRDEMMCHVETKFGHHGWEISPVKVAMAWALCQPESKNCLHFQSDGPCHYFARFLLEGKVLPELEELPELLNDSPAIITGKAPVAKVALLVSALSNEGICNVEKLQEHWALSDDKFLFKCLKSWVKKDCAPQAQQVWIRAVKENIKAWNRRPVNAV